MTEIDFTLLRWQGCEVAPVFLECLEFGFRVLIRDALVAAQFGDRAFKTASRLRPCLANVFFQGGAAAIRGGRATGVRC